MALKLRISSQNEVSKLKKHKVGKRLLTVNTLHIRPCSY